MGTSNTCAGIQLVVFSGDMKQLSKGSLNAEETVVQQCEHRLHSKATPSSKVLWF